jgi:glutamate racemase
MIGILDSGLGGLSVLREMQRQLPACDFLYFGDTARGASDDKSPGLVAAQTADGLSRLEKMGASLLVVADHGAAACLTADTRKRFSIPMLDIVSDGVAPGAASLSAGAVGIIGPSVVEIAGAHQAAIRNVLPGARIFSIAAPLLSSLVDAGWLKKPETVMIVKKYLHFFRLRQVDALVPASNHYLHLMPVIGRKIGKRVTVVDAVSVLALEAKTLLEKQPELKECCTGEGNCRAVVSDLTDSMEKNARMFYGKNIRIEQV